MRFFFSLSLLKGRTPIVTSNMLFTDYADAYISFEIRDLDGNTVPSCDVPEHVMQRLLYQHFGIPPPGLYDMFRNDFRRWGEEEEEEERVIKPARRKKGKKGARVMLRRFFSRASAIATNPFLHVLFPPRPQR
jgi:hypothetical protein